MIGYVIFALLANTRQIVAHLNLKMPPVVAEITYKNFQSLGKDFKIDFKYSLIY